MVTWSDNEVLQLISFWGEEGVQAQLEGSKRNKYVYEKISKTLARNGIHKSSDQCRAKMKKLKTDYRKVKDKNGKTGRGRSIWKYFDALDAILGHRPATKPPLLLDTAAEEMIVASTIITTKMLVKVKRNHQLMMDRHLPPPPPPPPLKATTNYHHKQIKNIINWNQGTTSKEN